MGTRATIHIAKREEGVSFSEIPDKTVVEIYHHWDGYPEGLGVEIAESFTKYRKVEGWEVEALDMVHGDIEYLYYVWQCHGKSEPWISIFEIVNVCLKEGECIFVGTPDMLLKKYGEEMENPEIEDEQRSLCDDFCSEHGCPFLDDRDPDPFWNCGCCKNTN